MQACKHRNANMTGTQLDLTAVASQRVTKYTALWYLHACKHHTPPAIGWSKAKVNGSQACMHASDARPQPLAEAMRKAMAQALAALKHELEHPTTQPQADTPCGAGYD